MEQKYRDFLSYDFDGDEQFRRYLDAIEPPPPLNMLGRYKKKFYRLKVDREFDVEYEPATAKPCSEQKPNAKGASVSKYIPWTTKLQMILFTVYFMTFCIGYLLRSYYHMVPLGLAFAIGVLKKHGRPKLSSEYWQGVVLDDHLHNLANAVVCTLSFSSTVALSIPLFLRALIFIADFISLAAKKKNKLAILTNNFTGSIAAKRESLLTFKADFEIYIGFYLFITLIMRWTSLYLVYFYWQLMQIKYSVSVYTNIAFTKLAAQMDAITSHSSCPFFVKWPLKALRKLGTLLVGMTQQ